MSTDEPDTTGADDAFDVVILGAGAGAKMVWGSVPGRSVAVVEEGRVGGACPFVACIPSKAMLRTAAVWDLAADHDHGQLFSGRVPAREAYRLACERRDRIVHDRNDGANADALTATGAVLLRGRGRIQAPGVLDVGGRTVRYGELVVNTGSRSRLPEVRGLDTVPVWTSDDAMSTTHLPDSLLVLGGGPVGCELAYLFATFGTRVTLVQRPDRLLPAEEPQVAETVRRSLTARGVDVRVGSTVGAVREDAGGLVATLDSGETVGTERILVATGRRPNSDALGFENLGITTRNDGSVLVDARCAVVGADHVWAVGDVTGVAPFTHTAHYQGRVVAANLRGEDRRSDYGSVPRAAYLQPTMAAVGHTVATARSAGIEPLVATERLGATKKATTEGSDDGWLMVLADPRTGELIGATAMGGAAEEWITLVSLAIRAHLPARLAADVVHPFPTFGELLEGPLWELSRPGADGREPGTPAQGITTST
jgi:pyruvate/2-oxoglutarate dehydrogenase complex dihydrolipoamide dehydrogenase (E3) component